MALRLEFVLNQGSEVAHGISPVIGQGEEREPGQGSRTGTELAKRQGVGATLRQRLTVCPDGHRVEQDVEHVKGSGFGHVAGDAKEEDGEGNEDVEHDLTSNWVPYRTRFKGGTRLV